MRRRCRDPFYLPRMVVIPHRGRPGAAFENEAICSVNWLILCFAPRVIVVFIHESELARRGATRGRPTNLNEKGLQMNWPFVVGAETRWAGAADAAVDVSAPVWSNCQSDIFSDRLEQTMEPSQSGGVKVNIFS